MRHFVIIIDGLERVVAALPQRRRVLDEGPAQLGVVRELALLE